LKTTAALVLGFTALVVPAESAHAGSIASVGQLFASIDEWRLDHTPQNFTGPRPGQDFTMLAVRNNTDRPIFFAASWVPYRNPYDNSSQLSSTNGSPWIHQAWHMVPPGQVLHFGNTTNGVFYLFAVQPDSGRILMQGEHFFNFPNADRPLPCRRIEAVFMDREITVDVNP
jgi:hypothetical protein